MSSTIPITDTSSPQQEIEVPSEEAPASISQLLYLPYQISYLLTRPVAYLLIWPMLAYHLFVYIYLGQKAGGSDFYNGFMYAFNYAGTSVAYWVICRQNQALLSSVNIISKEVVTRSRREDEGCCYEGCCDHYESSHFQLLHNNLGLLKKYPTEYSNFTNYCRTWQRRMYCIFVVWMGFATVNILAKIFPDALYSVPDTFDNEPLGLYGYYNLSGQYIASLAIVTGAVTLLSGFYQLKCLIIGFANHLRQYRTQEITDSTLIKAELENQRETYLQIQKSCLALSDLWSIPVLVSLFFCTQVVISNILVIHYSLRDCRPDNSCDFQLVYPVVWLLTGLFIMAIALLSMADINHASGVLQQIFTYSKGGDSETEDYRFIGGRQSWIDYLTSNRLLFCICGVAVTPTLVINTSYTVGTAVMSIMASYILG